MRIKMNFYTELKFVNYSNCKPTNLLISFNRISFEGVLYFFQDVEFPSYSALQLNPRTISGKIDNLLLRFVVQLLI